MVSSSTLQFDPEGETSRSTLQFDRLSTTVDPFTLEPAYPFT